ncbi:MAG: hypothetical protein E7047_03275 [Lentisphaerae bacterium]|nr:hypothetical protein [Lentisphaerota bacterium]
MSNWAIGIISGLVAGLMQSCSYLGGQRFLNKYNNSAQMVICSLLITGAVTWLMAPFFLYTSTLFSWRMLLYVIMTDIGLVVGHWGFFSAQKHIESSRIASLMGLKVLVVAVLSIVLLRIGFTFLQYLAMLGAASAGLLMNWNQGKLNWNGMGYMLVCFIGYAFSDLGVQLVVQEMPAEDPIAAGFSGFIVNYSVTGLGALCLIKKFKIDYRMLCTALPQGLCWVVSMWGLYICFGLVGAAFGNVLQASRGIISLVIGIILSYFAMQSLEKKQSADQWVRKAVAALIMFGSIMLYAFTAKG